MQSYVTKILHGSITEDGEYAELVFQLSDGSTQILNIAPGTFFQLLSNAFDMFLYTKIQKGLRNGYHELFPLHVLDAVVRETLYGEKILLSLMLKNHVPVDFAFDPPLAELVFKQLSKAINKTHKNIKKH